MLRPRVAGVGSAVGVDRTRAWSSMEIGAPQRDRHRRAIAGAPRRRGISAAARAALLGGRRGQPRPSWPSSRSACATSRPLTARTPARSASPSPARARRSSSRASARSRSAGARSRRPGRGPPHAAARPRTGKHLRQMHAGLMRAQGRRDKPDAWWQALARFASDDSRGALFACDFEGRTVAAAVVHRHAGLVTYAWGASGAGEAPLLEGHPCPRRGDPLGPGRRLHHLSTSAAFLSRGTPIPSATPSPPSSTTSTSSASGWSASTEAGAEEADGARNARDKGLSCRAHAFAAERGARGRDRAAMRDEPWEAPRQDGHSSRWRGAW